MLLQLLLLFTLVPLVELMLLIKIGEWISLWPTIGLVVFTGIIGASLARKQGIRTWTRIRTDLGAGILPGDRLIDALLILIAGALLVTPGVITDGIGFFLLIPPARALIRNHLKKQFKSKFVIMNMNDRPQPGGDEFIDVEVHSPED